jgi:DNA-binding CsgD family transcriptional regulator
LKFGKGDAALIITYAIMAVIATILLIGYVALVRKKERWLLLLYICVTVVNVGYFLLSVSNTVTFAIIANDIVYFGSVFLSMSMLLTIVRLCGFEVKNKLVITLSVIGLAMFAIIATAGILPWYYKEVSLTFVDGAAKLQKVYGVLHPTYLLYLLVYFSAMVACIVQSIRKKMIASQRHAVLLAAIVFGNIAVWFVEKFIPWDFEFLSVSYIFSEIVLLGLYWMMQDYVRVDLVPQPTQEVARPAPVDIATMPMEEKILKILSFLKEGELLATREREILEMVLENKKRKEIADELCLSENTIKTYTRTLYGKLGVSSREELYALLIK